jgi:hypothetical protein
MHEWQTQCFCTMQLLKSFAIVTSLHLPEYSCRVSMSSENIKT